MRSKLIFNIVLLFVTSLCNAQTDVFSGSFEELEDKAQKEKKPYIVDFYAPWCGYCKKFDKVVLPDSNFSSTVNGRFVFGRINGEAEPQIAEKFDVKGYPTFLVFNENGELVKRFNGYVDAQSFIKALNDLGFKQKALEVKDLASYEELKSNQVSEQWAQFTSVESDLNLIRESILAKSSDEFNVLELEDLKIDYPESEDYVVFYYNYSKKGLDLDALEKVYKEEVLSFEETSLLFIDAVIKEEKGQGDNWLRFVNTLLLEQPDNYDLLDVKAYLYYYLGRIKEGEDVAKRAKKIASKEKKGYSSTKILLEK